MANFIPMRVILWALSAAVAALGVAFAAIDQNHLLLALQLVYLALSVLGLFREIRPKSGR